MPPGSKACRRGMEDAAPETMGLFKTWWKRSKTGPASGLVVRVFRSLDALSPFARDLAQLNLASRRPTPFDTLAYMRLFRAHDEHKKPGEEPLILMAFEGEKPVGVLPLRRVPERIFGVPCASIAFLMTHDNERPRVIAQPEDEARCAQAFYRYLTEEEKGWDLLHLHEQDHESALSTVPSSVNLKRYYVRRFPTNPNATLPLPYPSLPEYGTSLHRNHRRKLSQAIRRLREAGSVELWIAKDNPALARAFELYLDIEQRSWKVNIRGHIGRHTERVAFFRKLVEQNDPLKMAVYILLLDGVPIAGMVGGAFEGVFYAFEEAFDEGYRDLSPGNVMLLLLIWDTIESRCRALDLFGNYAYYKAHWGATITDTQAVQLFRKGSLAHLKALAGEVKRWLSPPVTQRDVAYNLDRGHPADGHPLRAALGDHEPEKGDDAHWSFVHPPRDAEKERATRALADMERPGTRLVRLSGEALARALSFRKEAPPAGPRKTARPT